MKVKIVGTGSAVPEKCVTNDDLSQWMDTSDEWIRSWTGIETRHLAVRETTTEMAVEAVKRKGTPSARGRGVAGSHHCGDDHAGPADPEPCLRGAERTRGMPGSRLDVSTACSGFWPPMAAASPLFRSRRKPARARGDWCGDIVADHGLERPEYLCVVWGWRRCGSAGSR